MHCSGWVISMRFSVCWPYVATILVLGAPPFATAAFGESPAALCEKAATAAAQRHGIPEHLLQTLTLTETGRTRGGHLRPWPWAINHAGQGHWFDTAPEMISFAEELISQGATNFDIGCFQLNYRWHGNHFGSVNDMADPARNADYAASFLLEKFAETGAWRSAVGAYHSRTAVTADIYLARFEAVFSQWAGGAPAAEPAAVEPAGNLPIQTSNNFPLLISGLPSRGASLVPVVDGGNRLIGASE
jgi:hypothetical protein